MVKFIKSLKKTNRDTSMDVLRIICCVFIILLHTSGHLDLNSKLWRIIQAIVRPALWTFMALTGYFIFRKPIDNYFKFWFKHILGLIIPVTIYLAALHVFYNRTLIGFDPFVFIKGDSLGHLWYVYSLIQIYLLAPFLQKMYEGLNKKQLLLLICAFLIISRGIKILANFGLTIGFSTNIIEDCCLFYVTLGYYLYKYPIKLTKKFLIYIISIINTFALYYASGKNFLVPNLYTLSFGMAIGVVCYITIFDQSKNLIKDRLNKLKKIIGSICSFIGKRTYGIYIAHIPVFQYLTNKSIFQLSQNSSVENVKILALETITIFIISLVVSIILDGTVVFIVKWLLFKLYDFLEESILKLKQMNKNREQLKYKTNI